MTARRLAQFVRHKTQRRSCTTTYTTVVYLALGLMKINQHRDIASSGHLRYERGLILFEETSYPGKCLEEYIGHFAALTIPGSKCKRGHRLQCPLA